MSGPSTLRLCFAAMAPALTEAASARLKLQDPGTKHRDTRAVQGDCNVTSPKADHLSPPRKNGDHEPFALRNLKTAGDRVGPTNGTHGDTVRSLPKGKGGGLNLTSSVVSTSEKNKNNSSSVNIGHITSLTVTGKQFSPLIDGVGEDIKTNGFLEGLKRMNQPYFTANTNTDQSFEGSNNHFNSSDTLRILASKVVSQTGMVNGDSGNDRKKEEEQQSVKKSCVRESGDARVSSSSLKNDESKYKIPEQKKGPLKFTLPVETDKTGTSNTMGMCEKDTISLSTRLEKQLESSLLAKKSEMEKPCEDVRKDCVKKQAYLERKVEMLLRRLKRVKGRVVENHTKEQLLQYVNFQHRNLQMVAKSIKNEAPCPEMFKEHFLSNEDVKNMSTSQLVKLVRDNQSNKSLPVTGNSRYRMINTSASVMSPGLQLQSFSTSERLSLRVQATENDLDSDATASSSGGESCDEESPSCPPKDTALPSILKRAEWKWTLERAAIVARWTWLQAQVSDLEYKIRQQSQVHRQLRNSKGGVVLGDPPTAIDILRKLQGFKPNVDSSSSVSASASVTTDGKSNNTAPGGSSSTEVSPYNVTRLLSNVDRQASRLTQTLNCISPLSSTVGSPSTTIKLLSPATNPSVADSPSSSNSGVESEIARGATADNSPLVTASTTTSSSSSFSNIPQQQQSIPEHSSSLHSSSSTSTSLSSSSSSISDASFQAARCRPLRSYRKRKILRTIDLYKTSVKAARLSDVRCRCYPPSNPCAMCGGRYNNTLSMDAENMSFNERVALLDASFHPVLSFPQDIPLSVHCEGFLKSGLWQNKPQSKRSKSGDYRRQKVMSFAVPESVTVKKSQASNNKISNGRGNSSAPSVINFTTKIKNKYEGKTKAKKTGAIARTAPLKHKVNKAKKNAAKLSKAMKKKMKKELEEDVDDLEAMYLEQEANCSSSSARDDRLSNSASGTQTPTQKRRRADNAFDINNIEIPHSIAASTRVEQIRYKEIVTPKWRVVAEDSSSPQDTPPSPPPQDGNSNSSLMSSSSTTPTSDPPVVSQQPPPLLPVDPSVMTPVAVAVTTAVAVASKLLEKTNGVSVSASAASVASLEQHQEKIPVVAAVTTPAADVAVAVADQEVEDLSDEAYLRRHSLPEQEERKRFRNFLQYPPIRRNRARSDAFLNNNNSTVTNNNPTTNNDDVVVNNDNNTVIAASTTSATASTSVTASTTADVGGEGDVLAADVDAEAGVTVDDSLVNRSFSSSVPTATVEESGDQQQQPTARRKSMLAPGNKRERSVSAGPSEAAVVLNLNSIDPWPSRPFPLSEDDYTRMQSESSSSSSNCEPLHQEVDRCLATEPSGKVYVGGSGGGGSCVGRSGSMDVPDDGCASAMSSRQGSRAPSPHPSLESMSSIGDDPGDPDWAVSLSNAMEDSGNAKVSTAMPRYRRTSHTNPNIGDPDWTGSDNPKKGKKR